jgi:hypothetical protein
MLLGIVSLSWLLLFLDPSALGERVGVGLTLLLTAVTYKQSIADSLPAISFLTPLDKYVLSNFAFLYCVLLECVAASVVNDRHGHQAALTFDRCAHAFMGVVWLGGNLSALVWMQHRRAARASFRQERATIAAATSAAAAAAVVGKGRGGARSTTAATAASATATATSGSSRNINNIPALFSSTQDNAQNATTEPPNNAAASPPPLTHHRLSRSASFVSVTPPSAAALTVPMTTLSYPFQSLSSEKDGSEKSVLFAPFLQSLSHFVASFGANAAKIKKRGKTHAS